MESIDLTQRFYAAQQRHEALLAEAEASRRIALLPRRPGVATRLWSAGLAASGRILMRWGALLERTAQSSAANSVQNAL